MTYNEWEDDNKIKKDNIITKLQEQGKTTKEIIDYFDFDNMVENEPLYCLLYETNSKCHNIELNCFFCGCPYFEHNNLESSCTINAPLGTEFMSYGITHQDCTYCDIPHKPFFVHSMAPKYIEKVSL